MGKLNKKIFLTLTSLYIIFNIYPASAENTSNLNKEIISSYLADLKNAKDFTLNMKESKELPYTLIYKDKSNYLERNFEYEVIVEKGYTYKKIEPNYLYRINSKNPPKNLYYKDGKNNNEQPNLTYILKDILLAPKYGIIEIIDDKTFKVELDIESNGIEIPYDDYILFDGYLKSSLEYKINTQNILEVKGYRYTNLYPQEKIYIDIKITKGSKFSIPSKKNIIDIYKLESKLKPLPEILKAALDTAIDAEKIAQKKFNIKREVEDIYLSAENIPTPKGLLAFYIDKGLRYTVGKESICIILENEKFKLTKACKK